MPAEAQAEAVPVREARPREPKTATVERREASVPRHGTHGASQAPDVSRHGTSNGCASAAPERLSALRPPLDWGERSKEGKNLGADMRRGNEEVSAVAKAMADLVTCPPKLQRRRVGCLKSE